MLEYIMNTRRVLDKNVCREYEWGGGHEPYLVVAKGKAERRFRWKLDGVK